MKRSPTPTPAPELVSDVVYSSTRTRHPTLPSPSRRQECPPLVLLPCESPLVEDVQPPTLSDEEGFLTWIIFVSWRLPLPQNLLEDQVGRWSCAVLDSLSGCCFWRRVDVKEGTASDPHLEGGAPEPREPFNSRNPESRR